MKINKKLEPYIFTVIISLINIGFVDNFFLIWVRAWIPAFFIALIPAFFMGKLARSVLSKIIDR